MGGGVSIPIHELAKAGDLEGFQLAIKKQKKSENLIQLKNENEETALFVAAALNRLAVCQYILSLYGNNYADVNESNKEGNRALHAAALKGNLEVCQALVAASADVNVVNEVSTVFLVIRRVAEVDAWDLTDDDDAALLSFVHAERHLPPAPVHPGGAPEHVQVPDRAGRHCEHVQ